MPKTKGRVNYYNAIVLGVDECFYFTGKHKIRILKKEAVRLSTHYPDSFNFDFVKDNGVFNRATLLISER